jgi:hypothetical protein
MDDAQVIAAIEKYALAVLGDLEHRPGIVGQIRLDDERIEPGSLGHRLEQPGGDGFLERVVDRHLDRDVPAG